MEKKQTTPLPLPSHGTSKQVLKKLGKPKKQPPITKPSSSKQSPSPPPSQTPPLSSYVELACATFHDVLILPEKGMVKVTITVQPNGKIGKVEVETFESRKNLDYLMAVLPTLTLPKPEGGNHATFTILFCDALTSARPS